VSTQSHETSLTLRLTYLTIHSNLGKLSLTPKQDTAKYIFPHEASSTMNTTLLQHRATASSSLTCCQPLAAHLRRWHRRRIQADACDEARLSVSSTLAAATAAAAAVLLSSAPLPAHAAEINLTTSPVVNSSCALPNGELHTCKYMQ
jgi:hypothetical protein